MNPLVVAKELSENDNDILIPYRKGNKWGFCNQSKFLLIPCQYDYVSTFDDDLAVVMIIKNTGLPVKRTT